MNDSLNRGAWAKGSVDAIHLIIGTQTIQQPPFLITQQGTGFEFNMGGFELDISS